MTGLTNTQQKTVISDAEYEAMVDQQLQEISAMLAQMERPRAGPDRWRTEMQSLREEAKRVGDETRARIAHITRLLDDMTQENQKHRTVAECDREILVLRLENVFLRRDNAPPVGDAARVIDGETAS